MTTQIDIIKGLKSALMAERCKRRAAEQEAWIRRAYCEFLRDRSEVESAIFESTKMSRYGAKLYLEIWKSGNWDLLPESEFLERRYISDGILIAIPPMSEDEFDEEDQIAFFDRAIEELDQRIEDVIAGSRFAAL